MRITYDAEANAAYLYLQPVLPGQVAETLELTDTVNFDVAEDGLVLGLEVLDATAFFGDFSAVFGGELVLPERINRETGSLGEAYADAVDLADLREAVKAEKNEPGVPTEEVKKQLGLA